MKTIPTHVLVRVGVVFHGEIGPNNLTIDGQLTRFTCTVVMLTKGRPSSYIPWMSGGKTYIASSCVSCRPWTGVSAEKKSWQIISQLKVLNPEDFLTRHEWHFKWLIPGWKILRVIPDRRKCNLINCRLDSAIAIVPLWQHTKFHTDGAAILWFA